jgi:hypothetical protein
VEDLYAFITDSDPQDLAPPGRLAECPKGTLGQDFSKCFTIYRMLEAKFRSLGNYVKAPFDNTAESQYFDIRFFKKGTVHLTFKEERLWEKFNVTAAKGKAWLGENTQDERPEQTSLWRTSL